MPALPLSLLWVVPALPLAGFVVNGTLALTRPTAKRVVSIVGVGTLVLAFAAAALAVAGLARQHATAPLVFRYWEWMPAGDLQVAFALQLGAYVDDHGPPGDRPRHIRRLQTLKLAPGTHQQLVDRYLVHPP